MWGVGRLRMWRYDTQLSPTMPSQIVDIRAEMKFLGLDSTGQKPEVAKRLLDFLLSIEDNDALGVKVGCAPVLAARSSLSQQLRRVKDWFCTLPHVPQTTLRNPISSCSNARCLKPYECMGVIVALKCPLPCAPPNRPSRRASDGLAGSHHAREFRHERGSGGDPTLAHQRADRR